MISQSISSICICIYRNVRACACVRACVRLHVCVYVCMCTCIELDVAFPLHNAIVEELKVEALCILCVVGVLQCVVAVCCSVLQCVAQDT